MSTSPDDVIDTTPPEADPEAAGETSPEHSDALDTAAFDDEPWSDLDPEAFDDPSDVEELAVSFGGPVKLENTSTPTHWLQSALRALVAPNLGVDGIAGPRTTKATARFQRRSETLGAKRLDVDGVAGPDTIAALETITQSKAPAEDAKPDPEVTRSATQATPEQATPEQATATTKRGDLDLRETVNAKGVTVYTISSGDDEVSFSYWTPGFRNYKPYNVSRYKGARKGLVSDEDMAAFGLSTGEVKILRANAMKESGGAFGAINTWDNQIVSWGMAQFAGLAGTLAVLLARIAEHERTRKSFERWFLDQGIAVERGPYPWRDGKTKKGWHVVITGDDGKVHRGNEGWDYMRTQPRLLGAFMLAGNDPMIQLGQIDFWCANFLRRAIDKQVSFASGPGGPIRRYLTSERGLAVIVRLHNWMPVNVVKWSNRFIAELEAENPGRDLSDPFEWDQAIEDAFVQKICDERKRVKSGSYDTYALDLSTERGSFVGPPTND